MPTHVALLRGVNVGGRKVAMSDLREIVTSLGHDDVSTYVNSGNALFRTSRSDTAELAAEIEKAITDRLSMDVGVVVLSGADLQEIIDANPFPDEPNPKAVHAVVRSGPLGPELAERVSALVAADTTADTARAVGRVLYLHTPNGLGRSDLVTKLTRLLGSAKANGVSTARNWSTITTLRDRLDG